MPSAQDARGATAGGDPLIRRLVIRPGALGDFVVSVPAIVSLQPREIWCSGENAPLAALLTPRATPIASTGLDLLELGLEPALLRSRLCEFDEIVSWYGASRTAFREAAREWPFRFLPALPREGASLHAVDFYLEQVGQPLGAVPALPVSPVARREFVAIHPFSGSVSKNWPLDRFQAVAERLPIPVEWSAGPDEHLPGARRFDSRLELARWLAEARCYLGNDSGVSHLTAAVGTPVVALFGPSDPRVWSPRGRCVAVLDQRTAGVEEVARRVIEAAGPHPEVREAPDQC